MPVPVSGLTAAIAAWLAVEAPIAGGYGDGRAPGAAGADRVLPDGIVYKVDYQPELNSFADPGLAEYVFQVTVTGLGILECDMAIDRVTWAFADVSTLGTVSWEGQTVRVLSVEPQSFAAGLGFADDSATSSAATFVALVSLTS